MSDDETKPSSDTAPGIVRPHRVVRRSAADGPGPTEGSNTRSAPLEEQSTRSAVGGAAANPAAAASNEPDPYDMSQYSRRALDDDDGNGQGAFKLPARLKRPGWDYEFKTTLVLGEPARASDRAMEFNQGWRPVPAQDVAELLPPGYEGRHFEIDGQILMMRPKALSIAAKQELADKAERQKRDKMKSALAGDPDGIAKHDHRMPRTAATITLEGEVGVHEQQHARPAA